MFKTSFETKAMIHSLRSQDSAIILHENGSGDVVAEYKGKRYTAIFNPFVCLYYLDDIYGLLPNQTKCPKCGVEIQSSAEAI
jgi:hypothetical protein